MKNLSLSEKYAIGAVIALLLIVLINDARIMLVIAIAGLIVGVLVVRSDQPKRVAFVAAMAFALALGFALFALLR